MKCDRIRLYEYLDGSLNPDQARETSAHLENCAACRERFRIMEILDRREEQAVQPKPQPASFRGEKWMLLAATLLLTALLSLFYSLLPGSSDAPALASLATRRPYPLVLLETREGDGEMLPRGLQLYREGRYREALSELEKAENSQDALFFSGVSLYLLDEPARAAQILKRVAEVSEKWADPADWYYSQALLRMGRRGEAIRVLRRLSASDNRYRVEARVQLGKIMENEP